MLFDLKGKRKRVVQVTYLALAILFGGSLVLFGTGSSVSGGLIDAITGNNGGGANSAFQDQVDRTRKAVRVNPKSAQAWLDLTRAEFNFAASPDGSDADTGQLTDAGKQAVLETINSWERYLKLKPKEPDAATGPVRRDRIRRDPGLPQGGEDAGARGKGTAQLEFLLPAGAVRLRRGPVSEGDAAAAQAIRRTPKDLRNSVRAQIKDIKKQGAQLVKQRAAAAEGEQAGDQGPAERNGLRAAAGTGRDGRPARRSVGPQGRSYNRRGRRWPPFCSRAVSSTGRAGAS